MGCCHSIEKVESSLLKNKIDLDKYPKEEVIEILKQIVNESSKSYEDILEIKINPKRPLNLSEFEQIVRYSVTTEIQNFTNKFQKIPEKPEILTEYKKFRIFLSSKCSAKEGYFRNLNDYYSSDYVTALISEIIHEFFEGKISYEDGINKYQRLARGSYVISGLQGLHNLLKQPSLESAVEQLNNEVSIIKETLSLHKKELERASRKALLPITFNDAAINPDNSMCSPLAKNPSPVEFSPVGSFHIQSNSVSEFFTSKSYDTGNDNSVNLHVRN